MTKCTARGLPCVSRPEPNIPPNRALRRCVRKYMSTIFTELVNCHKYVQIVIDAIFALCLHLTDLAENYRRLANALLVHVLVRQQRQRYFILHFRVGQKEVFYNYEESKVEYQVKLNHRKMGTVRIYYCSTFDRYCKRIQVKLVSKVQYF